MATARAKGDSRRSAAGVAAHSRANNSESRARLSGGIVFECSVFPGRGTHRPYHAGRVSRKHAPHRSGDAAAAISRSTNSKNPEPSDVQSTSPLHPAHGRSPRPAFARHPPHAESTASRPPYAANTSATRKPVGVSGHVAGEPASASSATPSHTRPSASASPHACNANNCRATNSTSSERAGSRSGQSHRNDHRRNSGVAVTFEPFKTSLMVLNRPLARIRLTAVWPVVRWLSVLNRPLARIRLTGCWPVVLGRWCLLVSV